MLYHLAFKVGDVTTAIAAEDLTIDIIVVVLAIVQHCKGCLLFFLFYLPYFYLYF